MVNRVDGPQYYQNQQDYQKVKGQDEDGPQFSLNPGENGVVWEKSEEEKKPLNGTSDDRVKIQSDKEADKGAYYRPVEAKEEAKRYGNKKTAAGSDSLDGLMDTAKKIFAYIKNAIQSLFYQEETVEKVPSQEMEEVSVEEESQGAGTISEEELNELVKKGNYQGVLDIVTEGGEKKLARNTQLLSFYDRSGKMVSIQPTERNQILYGEHAGGNFSTKV